MIRPLACWTSTVPELPEVETVAATLYPHVVDAAFTFARLLRPASLHPLSLPLETLSGLRIESTGRRGKLLLFKLDGLQDGVLVAHLRMTGRIFTGAANSEAGKHTRCVFGLRMPDGAEKELFFDDTRAFGQLLLATPDILAKWSFWRNLGPEPLEISADAFAERIKGRRPIKSVLMDQQTVAGIGNIYADESLFSAGISPLRPAAELKQAEIEKLLASIQAILRESISQCGSSIRDYRDANGNAGAFQNTLRVYGRGGQNCVNCGRELTRLRLSGRATVYCENCQK